MKVTAAILAFFLGCFGIQNFYLLIRPGMGSHSC
ncbi:NINE protein [Bifidobacterium kimbladii]